MSTQDDVVSEPHIPSTATKAALNGTYVRFVDQNGDPLPEGSVATIHVNTITGDVDDITFEGV